MALKNTIVTTTNVLGGGEARAHATKWVGGPGFEKPLKGEVAAPLAQEVAEAARGALERLGLVPNPSRVTNWATFAPERGEPGWWLSCEMFGEVAR